MIKIIMKCDDHLKKGVSISAVVLNLFTCCTPFKSPTNSRTPFQNWLNITSFKKRKMEPSFKLKKKINQQRKKLQ